MKLNKIMAATILGLLLFAGITAAYNIKPIVDVDVNDAAWDSKEVIDVDAWAEETLKDAVEGDYKQKLIEELIIECYYIVDNGDISDLDSAVKALQSQPKAVEL